MLIEKCEKQIKCDFYGCPKMAEVSIKTGKILMTKMHFCCDCLNELYTAIGNYVVPKSPKTPFKQLRKK